MAAMYWVCLASVVADVGAGFFKCDLRTVLASDLYCAPFRRERQQHALHVAAVGWLLTQTNESGSVANKRWHSAQLITTLGGELRGNVQRTRVAMVRTRRARHSDTDTHGFCMNDRTGDTA